MGQIHLSSLLVRRIILAIISVGLSFGMWLAATSPAWAVVVPGVNGRMVWDSYNPEAKLWVAEADGSNPQTITPEQYRSYLPSWSPDGIHIAYTYFEGGVNSGAEIYTINYDGTGRTRLTNNSDYDDQATWSPDGSKIVFMSTRDGNEEIYIMDANGGSQTRLTNNAARDRLPKFSPDGSKIIFNTDRDGDSEIYIMDADGDNQTNVTNSPSSDETDASWSPDGTKVVFDSDKDSTGSDIYTMPTAGGSWIRLTNGTGSNNRASWSPDGAMITFSTDRDGDWEAYTMKADGSDEKPFLKRSSVDDYSGEWAPTVGRPDAVSLPMNETTSIPILDNDTVSGLPLSPSSLSIVTDASHGETELVELSLLLYTPDEDFTGDDTVVYHICDTAAPQHCSDVLVSITVTDEATPTTTVCVDTVGDSTISTETSYALTSDQPLFSGTASANAPVLITLSGANSFAMPISANAEGEWSATPYQPLVPGTTTVSVTSTGLTLTCPRESQSSFSLVLADITPTTTPTQASTPTPSEFAGLDTLPETGVSAVVGLVGLAVIGLTGRWLMKKYY